ncbi:MAG TPA: MBL fold metallo-hydrolase [Bryobacteraceae bacterium]|nr:MBL fold metallo-hydrolase [Bryobacteraceae bacterium]
MKTFTNGIACWTLSAAFALAACSAVSIQAAEPDASGLDVIQVRPNFYMIAGAGGNISVQIGIDGVVLVDAGTEAAADRVLAAIRKLTPLPTRYIIDTGADPDHVGGNAKLSKAGLTIFTQPLGNSSFLNAMTNGGGASILAHNSVLARMSAPTGKTAAFPAESWPNEAFFPKRWYIRMNDEGVEILHQPGAHSDADTFVFFRKSDVVAAGDVLDTTRFPLIDIAKGGSVQGEIDALNRLIDLAIPPGPFIYEGVGTYVIPGHGRVCEQLDVVDYRDMVVEVRDAVADMIKQGMTLDQIKAAHPALPYEKEYGTEEGSTSQFVDSVYKSLTGKK